MSLAVRSAPPRLRSPLSRAAVAMVVVAIAAVALILLASDPAPPALKAGRTAETTTLPHTHANEAGGYSFRYPESWTVREDGTATTLTSPGREVVMSFGLGPAGTLEVAAQRLADALSATYTGIENLGSEAQEVAGHPALAIAGIGTNDHGVRVRFLAITVATPRGNRSISVFTAADSSPSRVLPPVQQVVGSFRP